MKRENGYSLLLIEDEVLLREAVKLYLEDYFEVIYEAGDGFEALELFKNNHIDIIITDIKMPGLNGIGFVKEIRKKDEQIPIIIMSAYSDKEYLLEATQLYLVKYLIKPVSEDKLLEALKICFKKLDKKNPNIYDLGRGFKFDRINMILTHNDKEIRLTSSQIKLLQTLLQNKNRAVSYAQLEQSISEDGVMSKDALRCLVRDLRKLSYKELIENISKIGYRIKIDG
jgi:DNA-binding response OmpR family regulator